MWKDVLKMAITIGKTTIQQEIPYDRMREFHSHRREESIFNSTIHKNVEPARGALVYCQLANVEHSGIYLGNQRIVQLNGKGRIEEVSLKRFRDHITTLDTDIFIPVNQKTREPLGESLTALKVWGLIPKSSLTRLWLLPMRIDIQSKNASVVVKIKRITGFENKWSFFY